MIIAMTLLTLLLELKVVKSYDAIETIYLHFRWNDFYITRNLYLLKSSAPKRKNNVCVFKLGQFYSVLRRSYNDFLIAVLVQFSLGKSLLIFLIRIKFSICSLPLRKGPFIKDAINFLWFLPLPPFVITK